MTLYMGFHDDRDVSASFHLRVGKDWLEASNKGQNVNALVYCGFEFRLALERVALELLLMIRGKEGFEEADLKALAKLKNLTNRIYTLVGNQRQIDLHVDYINILLEALKVSFTISKVDLRKAKQHWSTCSDVCHMQLSKGHTWGNEEFCRNVYADLTNIRSFLEGVFSGLLTWAKVADGLGRELRDAYVTGAASKENVLLKLKETGIHAVIYNPDGSVSKVIEGFEPGSHPDSD